MNNLFKTQILILSFFFSTQVLAAGAEATIELTPAGSFKVKCSEIEGFAKKQGSKYVAQNIKVNVAKLKTGVSLRDKHTKDRLEVKKFPEVVLLSAEGENGKGTGKIKIKNIVKDISGSFKVTGKELTAKFKVHLPDFKIKDIRYLGVGVEDDVVVVVSVPIK